MASELKSHSLEVELNEKKFSAVYTLFSAKNYINESVLTQIGYSKVKRYPYTASINIEGQVVPVYSKINLIWKNCIGVHFTSEFCVFKEVKTKNDFYLKPEFFDENGELIQSGVISLITDGVCDAQHTHSKDDLERIVFYTSILDKIELFLVRLAHRIDQKDTELHEIIMEIDAACKTMMLHNTPYPSETKAKLFDKVMDAVDLLNQEDNLELYKFARRMLFLGQPHLESLIHKELLFPNHPYKKIPTTPVVAELLAFQVTREMIVEYYSKAKCKKSTHADTTKPFKNSTSKIKGKNKLTLAFRNDLLVESIDCFSNYIISIKHARFFYDQESTPFLDKLLKLLEDMVQSGNKVYDHFWNVEEYDFDSCYDFLESRPVREDYILAGLYWVFKSFYTKLARNKYKPASKRECLPGCTVNHQDPNVDGTEILNAMMYFYLKLNDPYAGSDQSLETTIVDSIVSDTAMFKSILLGLGNKCFYPISSSQHKVSDVTADVGLIEKRKKLALKFIENFKADVSDFVIDSISSKSQQHKDRAINQELVSKLPDYENDDKAFDALWKNLKHKELWAKSQATTKVYLKDLFTVRFAVLRLQIVNIMNGDFNKELFTRLCNRAFTLGIFKQMDSIGCLIHFNINFSKNILEQRADRIFYPSMLATMIPESTTYWKVIENLALDADTWETPYSPSSMTNNVIGKFIKVFEHPQQFQKSVEKDNEKFAKDFYSAHIPMIKLMTDKLLLENIQVCNLLDSYIFTGELKMIGLNPYQDSDIPVEDEVLKRMKANTSLQGPDIAVLKTYNDALAMFQTRLTNGKFDFDRFLKKAVNEDYFKGFEDIYHLNKTAFILLHLIVITTNVIFTRSLDVPDSWKELVDYERLSKLYDSNVALLGNERYRFAKGKSGKVIMHMSFDDLIKSLLKFYSHPTATAKSDLTLCKKEFKDHAYLTLASFVFEMAAQWLDDDRFMPDGYKEEAEDLLNEMTEEVGRSWDKVNLPDDISEFHLFDYIEHTDFWKVDEQIRKATVHVHSVLKTFINREFEAAKNDSSKIFQITDFWQCFFRYIQSTYKEMRFDRYYFNNFWFSIFTVHKQSESLVEISTEGFPKGLVDSIGGQAENENKGLETFVGLIQALSNVGPEGMEKADFDKMIQKITKQPPKNTDDGHKRISKDDLIAGFANSIQAMMSGIHPDEHISIVEEDENDEDTSVDENDHSEVEESIDSGTTSRHDAVTKQETVDIEEVIDEQPVKEVEKLPDMIQEDIDIDDTSTAKEKVIPDVTVDDEPVKDAQPISVMVQEDIDIDDAPTIKKKVIEEMVKPTECPRKEELQSPDMVQEDIDIDDTSTAKEQVIPDVKVDEAQPIPDMAQEDIDIDDAPTIKEKVIEENVKAAELPVKEELQSPDMVQDNFMFVRIQIKKEVCLEELLDLGEIVPSTSKYASPAVFLPNETNGEMELYVDFTNVNKEIPIIDYDRFDSRWSLASVFKKQYHKSIVILDPHKRLTMDDDEAAKTAFIIDGKKYQFTHRPKGFQNTDYHVYKLMEKTFSGIENIFFSGNRVYLSGDTESEVDEVYAKFNTAIRANKLRIFAYTLTQTKVTVNGYSVSKGGLVLYLDNHKFVEMFQESLKLCSNLAISQKYLYDMITFLLFYRNSFSVNPTILSDVMDVYKGALNFANIFGSRVHDELERVFVSTRTKTDDNDVEMTVSCDFSGNASCAVVYDKYGESLVFSGSVYYNKKSIIEDKMSLNCQQVLLINRAWKHFTKIVDETKLKFNGAKYQHLNGDPKELFSLKERAYIEARCGLDVWKVLKTCLDC